MSAGSVWLLVGIALLSFVLSLIGAAVGLILGHVRLPLLIGYLGGNPAAGAATNLIISGIGALAGSTRHARDGLVSWRCLALMGIPTAAGAALGAILAVHVSRSWLYLVIGLVLVVSGLNLARPEKEEREPTEAGSGWAVVLEVPVGLALGMLAVLTGLMLGSLRLPILIRLFKLDPRVAAGSTMAIGALTALTGTVTSFALGVPVDWVSLATILAAVGPPTVLGGYLGGWLTGRLPKETVRVLAGGIIVATGVLMIGQGAAAIFRGKSGVSTSIAGRGGPSTGTDVLGRLAVFSGVSSPQADVGPTRVAPVQCRVGTPQAGPRQHKPRSWQNDSLPPQD